MATAIEQDDDMTTPALHTLVPAFTLPDTHNHAVSLLDYKHQKSVVLIFCGDDCETLLGNLAERYPDYRQADAEILAIVPSAPRLQLPYPVLIDMNQNVTQHLAAQPPEILVLDSYGELYARFPGAVIDRQDHQKILNWLTLIQMQCPECGVPEWPYPEA